MYILFNYNLELILLIKVVLLKVIFVVVFIFFIGFKMCVERKFV